MVRKMASSFVIVLALSCGGSSGSSGGATSAASYAGVYNATYSGTYVVTSPANQPGGSNTDMATITITELSSGQLQAVWQIAPNPPSGTVDFALNGNTGTAVGAETGGMCFTGKLGNGDTQTNCCTACSITFMGTTFVQPNAGNFTGTTAAGTAYAGTYSGQWTGTKQ
jgi:hypothetical protein